MNTRVTRTSYRVIKDYRRSNADPIRLHKGDPIRVGRGYDGDPEWPGWIWCENQKGKGGWVPRSLITINGSTGTAREDYNARELCVQRGETLIVIAVLNGWARARRTNGETGWVPLRNIAPQGAPKPDPT
jgi:Variant SH3 domain/SH3 domain